MSKGIAERFYKSVAWKRTRAAYVSYRCGIDGGMCEVCGVEPAKIVHHKTWLTEDNISDPDVALSFANLRYECQACHNNEVDPAAGKSKARFRFDEDGNIIRMSEY